MSSDVNPADRRIRDDLDQRVVALLADDQFIGHPLRQVLEELMERMALQVSRLERIMVIPNPHQPEDQERFLNLSRRYDRQINRLEKAIRISDLYQSSLNELNRSLQQASTHDALTGLPNRAFMADCCQREDERVRRDGSTYALLVIDADRFKLINDTHGHEVGDQVLTALARSFERGIRDGDYCARWGGEEFLALLAGANLAAAQAVADRLLKAVRAISVQTDAASVAPRVSIGLAQHNAGETFHDVFRRADAALLEAKQQGRDRWCAAVAP